MIPQKIVIEGFLCYRTAQEIDLTGLRLCMLHGPNGSGKSTVFDAITFALFGTHRGGSRNLEDLINKKCDSARIIFEFTLDGSPWQIYRTIKGGIRGTRSTGDIRRPSEGGTTGQWEVVPDTSSADGLANWITSKLAMSGKAFTRSMLLRQGESDRILTCEPRERFEVLAGIAELEKYQDLERTANERRRLTEAEVESLRAQLGAIAPVSEAGLQEAGQQADIAAQRAQAADQMISALQERLHQARLWAELQSKVDQASQKQKIDCELIRNESRIEADYKELTTLSAVLPRLAIIVEQRDRVSQSESAARALTIQRDIKLQHIDAVNRQIALAGKQREAFEQQIPKLEQTLAALSQRISASNRILDVAKATEKQRCTLSEIDGRVGKITAKSQEPEKDLATAKQRLSELAGLSAALPILERFMESRGENAWAAARAKEIAASESKLAAEIEAAERLRHSDEADLAKGESAARNALKGEAEAQALLKHARTAMQELEKAQGRPDCPTCGQPLTATHLAQEREERAAKLAAWNRHFASAAQTRKHADDLLKALRAAALASEKIWRQLCEQHQKLQAARHSAHEEMVRSARDCKRAYLELPDELRTRISADALEDWTTSTWPIDEDLAELQKQAAELSTTKARVKAAETICAEWRQLTTQRQTLAEALAEHPPLPSVDLSVLQAEHEDLQNQQKQTTSQLGDARGALAGQRQLLRNASEQIQLLQNELGKIDTAIAVENANHSNFIRTVGTEIAQLPSDWSDRARTLTTDSLKALQSQAAELEHRGVRQAMSQLIDARTHFAAIEDRLTELRGEMDRIPAEARMQPQAIADQLETAKQERSRFESAWQAAQLQLARLEANRKRRVELEQSLLQSDRQLRHLRVLCDLLGKKRLQLHLVRQTERKIVECANHILERLSAGDLLLQLRQANDEKSDPSDQALDLVAIHRATGGSEPIAVAFLSGSQRFRVAVSLALAIGQVAGNHRSGECVIIDEGFGSLDRQGQDVMIQELQRLQSIMKRIILVSHQEAFADAFPQGYRFRLVHGEARVERMANDSLVFPALS